MNVCCRLRVKLVLNGVCLWFDDVVGVVPQVRSVYAVVNKRNVRTVVVDTVDNNIITITVVVIMAMPIMLKVMNELCVVAAVAVVTAVTKAVTRIAAPNASRAHPYEAPIVRSFLHITLLQRHVLHVRADMIRFVFIATSHGNIIVIIVIEADTAFMRN